MSQADYDFLRAKYKTDTDDVLGKFRRWSQDAIAEEEARQRKAKAEAFFRHPAVRIVTTVIECAGIIALSAITYRLGMKAADAVISSK